MIQNAFQVLARLLNRLGPRLPMGKCLHCDQDRHLYRGSCMDCLVYGPNYE